MELEIFECDVLNFSRFQNLVFLPGKTIGGDNGGKSLAATFGCVEGFILGLGILINSTFTNHLVTERLIDRQAKSLLHDEGSVQEFDQPNIGVIKILSKMMVSQFLNFTLRMLRMIGRTH